MFYAGRAGLNGAIGDTRVQLRSNRFGALAVLTLATALSGCANPEVFASNERWFERPFDWSGRSGGYAYSELQESSDKKRPVTANDLVNANGACPPAPVQAAPAPPTMSAATAAEPQGVMPAADAPPSLLGQAVELGMTECQVVYRAGAPSSVQIGANPNGERAVLLTYSSGPRPGIYRFEAGRLMDMDRVDVPAPAPKVAKREVKKKKKQETANPEQVSTQ
jgi:hypothetical protein